MGESTHANESGCLFTFAVVAAELVFVGWFLGQFLLDPVRCGRPGCEAMRATLNLSVISAVVGIGCVVLLASNNAFDIRIPPILLLVGATSAFAFSAVASVKAGLIILPLMEVMLMLMLIPTGLLLANELTGSKTERQTKRREYLTWVLIGLAIVMVFALWSASSC